MKSCPKCSGDVEYKASICPRCGLVFAKWEATQEHLKTLARNAGENPKTSDKAENPQDTKLGNAFLKAVKEPLGLRPVIVLAALLVGMSLFGKFGLAIVSLAGIAQLATLWQIFTAKSADVRRIRLRNGAIIFFTSLLLITWNDFDGG